MIEYRTGALSPAQAAQLEALVSLCRAHEGIRLSCPLDGDRFYVLEDGAQPGSVVSAVAVFEEDGLWECYGFTRPDCRRQGYFSRLAALLCQDAQDMDEEPELCFVTDHNSPDALKTLEAMGAEFWYEEHAMIWETRGGGAIDKYEASVCGAASGQGTAAVCGAANVNAASTPPLRLLPTSIPHDPHRLRFTAVTPDGQTAGGFGLYLSLPSACLYEVEIEESLRGRGLGRKMIRELQRILPAMGISRLTLQVSGENLPALGLYEKTGFRITETLSYYLY